MIRLTALIALDGQAPRALTHESNARQIYIGRDSSADFQVPLTTVSRKHVCIYAGDGGYTVEDLGSTHGTLLNGTRLEKGGRKVLRDGDVLEITKAKITCNIEADQVASIDLEGTQAIASEAVKGILGRMGPDDGDVPYFRLLNGPDKGQCHYLRAPCDEWAMGRSQDCEIVLNDANVSRRHAIIKKDWNGFLIQDLGSKNGVLINENKIGKPRRLKDQDEITIGPVMLLYVDPDAELMASLADVPGFEMETDPIEDEVLEPLEEEEGGEVEEVEEEAEEEEEEDEYAGIDDALLEQAPSKKFPTEYLMIGGVVILITLCVLLLVVIL